MRRVRPQPRLSAEELRERIKKLNERQQRYQGLQGKLAQQQATQVALTDPDARLMHQSAAQGGGSVVAYNVPSVVDAKHKLIVAHDVTTDSSDQQQLARMAGPTDAGGPASGRWWRTKATTTATKWQRASKPGSKPT